MLRTVWVYEVGLGFICEEREYVSWCVHMRLILQERKRGFELFFFLSQDVIAVDNALSASGHRCGIFRAAQQACCALGVSAIIVSSCTRHSKSVIDAGKYHFFSCSHPNVPEREGNEGEERTFRFPPVIVTLTNRRVYVILFFARPLGVFFFSCGSTYSLKDNRVSIIAVRKCGTGLLE